MSDDFPDLPGREEIERAALWRAMILPELREALDLLERARDRCPVSVERVRINRASAEVRGAIKEASDNAEIARRELDRLEGET